MPDKISHLPHEQLQDNSPDIMLHAAKLVRVVTLLLVVLTYTLQAVAQDDKQNSDARFESLLNEYWNWELSEDSWLATETGAAINQDRFPSETKEDQKRRYKRRKAFLDQISGLATSELVFDNQINHEVMRLRLLDAIANYEYGGFMMPITGRSGFHLSFAELSTYMKLESKQDFENYIARLNDFSRYSKEMTALLELGLTQGYTIPAVVLRETPSQVAAHIVDEPQNSELYKPFLQDKPGKISAEAWSEIQSDAQHAITQSVVPAYQELHRFLMETYLPKARSTIAARALPNGREFYQDRIRNFTTLDLTAQEIHQIGLREIARIRAEMDAVMKQLEYEGDLASFVQHLQNDPQHYAQTPEELMEYVALILKRIDGSLPQVFDRLPRTPYGLKEIPLFVAPQTTSAYYFPPAGDGTRAGYFFLNTYDLPQRPKFEMEALACHESVPGHHLQLALQQELPDAHPIRKFALVTSFVEGWGLYAERLGLEIGLYQDPYQNFGRLSMEAWRACRLVVDTGIHDMGWTRQQAIDYMRANTALSEHNITAEVDRYIGWPGQALGYMIGQLKILELRQRAEEALGERFDLRQFHNTVLLQGSVPLRILESQVDQWIEEEKNHSLSSGN